jgi:peptide chain release factor subunit 1
MTAATGRARELLARTGEHPVVSLYFDLSPDEFATAPARATQARSLVADAHNLLDSDASLGHDAREAVKGDLARLEQWLASEDLPVAGAAGLAIFACAAADVFETVVLGSAVPSTAFLARAPHVEPLVSQPAAARWAVALVSSQDAEIWFGHGRTIDAHEHSDAYVRGHRPSDDTTGRVNEQDVDNHLGEVAHQLDADWRKERFQTLMIGGPVAAASRLQGHLPHDLHGALAAERLDIEPSAVTEATLAVAVAVRLSAAEAQTRGALLARFADGLAGGGRAAGGVADVLDALGERRVATLLVGRDFHAAGTRCPRCGRLATAETSQCPVDATATAPVADLREPMIVEAIRQDADVVVARDPVDELPAARPVGALLRF